jgi:hypothetical protein
MVTLAYVPLSAFNAVLEMMISDATAASAST